MTCLLNYCMKHNLAKWTVPKTRTFPDPRVAIASHIGWTKPVGLDTDFHVPEPDNFNYGIKADRPYDCPHVPYQVFYKDYDGLWWSVYLITDDIKNDFLIWADPIKSDLRWTYGRTPKSRRRRPILQAKKSAAEMTLNERLYTMGYFDKLSNVSQTANDVLVDRLGPLREDLPNWPPRWQNDDDTELEEI